ncbi:TonB-dependent receptor [Bacteroides sp. OttesenSCG-928-E20]|nr:TonB-dependent receptor [Bacteroides sp. OttesenSCG-928-N06]MDL2299735.1 TonB-dependent receptor [Bacteroides sp. OttesenSCG-928-E20]MDL2305720.1 TonB-dependent receptor [Bacteroides sp. OttesenSCG-928-D19]
MIQKNTFIKFLPGSLILASLLCTTNIQAIESNDYPAIENTTQERTRPITGIVMDNGEPIIGANVLVKGTNTGTITDIDGKFNLNAAPGSILIVSYIGYTTQEINIEQQTNVTIQLATDSQLIDEVVVVGYGMQKKSDFTGAMVSVKEDLIKQAPVSNIATALQGLAPGVDVQMAGGSTHPGAVATIRIRGERTNSGSNDALIVVDGIPFSGNLNDISNDDIESVSVLKDASATAIYGARGASGVVLITTKRGQEGKATVSYSGYFGIATAIKKYDLMNREQFMRMKQWANYNADPNKYTGPDDESMMVLGALFKDQREIDGYNAGTDTDWQDLIFENGITTNHQIAVSGGSNKTNYNGSIGYFRSENSYPGHAFERMTAKVSLDSQINSFLKVGFSSMNSWITNSGEGDNPTEHALRATPFITPYNEDGSLILDLPGSGSQVWNPMLDRVDGAIVDRRRALSTFTNGYADITLPYGFKYRFNGGVDIKYETRGKYEASNTTSRKGGQNRAFADHYLRFHYIMENILTWDRTYLDAHNINFTGLFSYESNQRDGNSIESFDYFDDNVQFYNPGKAQGDVKGGGGFSKWQMMSYMARLNYNYKEKYYLTGTIRYDGSSQLAEGNKWHAFPSVALTWNIMREDFMQKQDVLSSLRLRASWGNVGNSSVSPYATMAKLGINRYMLGSNGVMGVLPNSVPNYSLGWENTRTVNFGLDFGFLSNRITGTLEVYEQYTTDLLLNVKLPNTSGYNADYTDNVGETRNRGIELNVTTVNIAGDGKKRLRWITDFNIFGNRNKVMYLGEGVERYGDIWVGQPLGVIRDYEMNGMWQDTPEDRALAESFGYATSGGTSVIGTVKVVNHHVDYEEDGVTPKKKQVINDDDKVFLGRRTPDFEGGINNRFEYMGFDLSFLFSYRYGGTLTSDMHNGWMNTMQGTYNNLNINYWTPENTNARWPKPSTGTVSNKGLLARYDASYLKLRNITIGYSVPKRFINKYSIQQLRLYATGSNLFTWFDSTYRKDGGIDPETTSSISIVTPPTRSFLFGLNLTF